jgi:methenyltetrahydromethanopterin cyclohydrolase
MPTLNERAWQLCDALAADAETLGIVVSTLDCGTRIIDCGAKAPGSDDAGVRLAEICLAGRGSVQHQIEANRVLLEPTKDLGVAERLFSKISPFATPLPIVRVTSDDPVAACMASQYAGWELKGQNFFAMGSGPMRAAACREELFHDIGHCEKSDRCVGVLETSKAPPASVCRDVAEKCGIAADRLTLCIARTASPAGTLQIVARSVETALHKLHVLGFDLSRVLKGEGSAPLPPVAADDLAAIGWTNDAILYGAIVELAVRGDDASLEAVGPKVPSNSSADHGRPFAEIFAGYDNDFYRIDPHLFSPAVVRFHNVDTGNVFCFGETAPEVLLRSFAKK